MSSYVAVLLGTSSNVTTAMHGALSPAHGIFPMTSRLSPIWSLVAYGVTSTAFSNVISSVLTSHAFSENAVR